MSRVLVLLPPSEGKAPGGDGPPYDPASGTFADLATPRREVAKSLRRRDFAATGQLGVKGDSLRAAMVANKKLGPTMPALRRYTGVLYAALDYAGRPPDVQRALDGQLVIVSGLLGLVAGADPVPDYKLPISASAAGLGRLAGFWRPHLARVLERHTGGAVVWDMLPAAHAVAARLPPSTVRWQVRVLREIGGRRVGVSHDNKAVKGALTRVIVAGQIAEPRDLGGWSGPGGYRVAAVTFAGCGGTVDVVQET